MMVKKFITAFIILAGTLTIYAQKERKYVRQGNTAFENEKFDQAEISYRKALDGKVASIEAQYNLAGSLYKQKKIDEAIDIYKGLTTEVTDKTELAKLYHNLGNAYLQGNKLNEAIEAYKNALRNNPNDNESRYNLAFAMDKNRKQMQEQQQKQDNKNQQKKEPSEYAKKIKKEAEALVAQHKYKEAYDLMKNAEKVDNSVVQFKDFTERIHDVVKIN